jgi:UPF0042 nucleotide-binding protein
VGNPRRRDRTGYITHVDGCLNQEAHVDILITAFGHPHGPAPHNAHITIGLRRLFAETHFDQSVRSLPPSDHKVIGMVKRTPGIRQFLAGTVAQAQAWALNSASQQPLHIALGCEDGSHRAGATAHLLARRLRRRGHQVTVHHIGQHQPIVERAAS